MNIIWLLIVIFCFVYAFMNGNIDEFVNQLFNVPQKSLILLISVGGLIIIYSGVFKVAEKCGIIDRVGKLFRFISFALFPRIPKDHIIHSYICSNITANLLGLGIASTPIALQTIKEMKKLNNESETATPEMIRLLVLNITAFTIFPMTILTLRQQYNSNLGILIWISLIVITFLTSILSLIIERILSRVIKWDIS